MQLEIPFYYNYPRIWNYMLKYLTRNVVEDKSVPLNTQGMTVMCVRNLTVESRVWNVYCAEKTPLIIKSLSGSFLSLTMSIQGRRGENESRITKKLILLKFTNKNKLTIYIPIRFALTSTLLTVASNFIDQIRSFYGLKIIGIFFYLRFFKFCKLICFIWNLILWWVN